MNTDQLQPWDLDTTAVPVQTLFPSFSDSELIHKTIRCLHEIDPVFAIAIKKIGQLQQFDLKARNNKQLGGTTFDLPLTGVPFVCMSRNGSIKDLRNFAHVCGHAIHQIACNKLSIQDYRQIPDEASELAARTIELLVFENGQHFFESKEQHQSAKKWLLESILKNLPQFAAFDRFQHWLYTHPNHNEEERNHAWHYIHTRFYSQQINHDDLQLLWHQKVELFSQPFSAMESGIAQLAAVNLWKNYLESPKQTIQQFKSAMESGHNLPLKKFYKKAGIKLDLSKKYIDSLIAFIQTELEKLG